MYKSSDWRQCTDEVTSSIGLIPSVCLILSIGYMSGSGIVFKMSWIHGFVKLFGWICVPCQVIKSCSDVIIGVLLVQVIIVMYMSFVFSLIFCSH